MKAEERFILVKVFINDEIKTIVGKFNDICDEIENQHKLNIMFYVENNSKTKKMVVYDRKYSTSDKELDCWEEVTDATLYSQFLDSYYGDEEL